MKLLASKSIRVQSLIRYSVGVWTIRVLKETQMTEAGLVKFQREVSDFLKDSTRTVHVI